MCVRWCGVPGDDVEQGASRPPDILVLHVGGNNLGIRSSKELIWEVKFDFLWLRKAFPDMLVLWSDIVAQTTWRMAQSVARINKTWIKINKVVGRFFIRNGDMVIRH